MRKKKVLIIFIIIVIIVNVFLTYNYIYLRFKNKKFIERNDVALADDLKKSPFKINNIVLYSSRIWTK